jgi:hypothetical protein
VEYASAEDAEKAVCQLDLFIQFCFPTFGIKGTFCVVYRFVNSLVMERGEMELEFTHCLVVWYSEFYHCTGFSSLTRSFLVVYSL